MTPAIGTLLCWNRAPMPEALFWHEAAQGARVVGVDELGGACRITVRPPAGARMASLPPPEVSYLQHDHRPEVLAAALKRLLGGARPARVLTAEAIDDRDLFAAAIAAFRPDIVAGGDAPEAWQRAFDERVRRRQGVTRRYRIDELAAFDVAAPDPNAPLPTAMIPAGRRATFLAPGCGGGDVRVILELLASTPREAAVRVTLDGFDTAIAVSADRIEATAARLPAAAGHVLRIGHDGPGGSLALIGVQIGPA